MSALGNLRGALRDAVRGARTPEWRDAVKFELSLMPQAVTSMVPWLLRARDERDESLVKVLLDNAETEPHGLAVEMHDERLTWKALADRTSRIAHVLTAKGVQRGDVVALVGQNSPTYVAAVLGIARVGATAALINNHLDGAPLSHAVKTSGARVAIVEQQFADTLRAREDVREQLRELLVYGPGDVAALEDGAPAQPFARVVVPTTTDYVYIYTSGTTGLPKPCRVSHARAVVAGASFGHMLFGFSPGDKLYSVLPLYHSSAMLIGVGSAIMTRTPIALRESFSASQFWPDVKRYRATAILYIGELCRYLVNTPPSAEERDNPVRVALGNGLRADVWPEFVQRFDIATVREFYSATEAPGAIFNVHNKVGSIGRVPMRRLSALKLAKYDVEADELLRDAHGFCIECEAGEVGQLLVKLDEKPTSAISDFRGYTDPAATQKKLIHDVFEKGDRYFLSGDLLRFDDNDFFYFVDRIGDTYRWKGENVSTAEVAEVISRAPGVLEATVTGVRVPGMEGQAGLAALVLDGAFDPSAFWRSAQELPGYAQPRFVRVMQRLATTGTFKIQKTDLRQGGIDPGKGSDPLFVRDESGYLPLDATRYQSLVEGRLRL